MKKALVLSGGNVKGSWQAGAIREVLKKGYEPTDIYGVSIGALNGAILTWMAQTVLKDGKPDWPLIGDKLVGIWTDQVRSFADVGRVRSKWGMFRRVVGLKRTFDSLLDMRAGTKLIHRNIKMPELLSSPINFSCGVVNLHNGTYSRHSNRDADTSDLLDYIVASTREPVTMPLHWINDAPYCDGGARNILPITGSIMTRPDQIVAIALKTDNLKQNLERRTYIKFQRLLARSTSVLTSEVIRGDLLYISNINYMAGVTDPQDPTAVKFAIIQPESAEEIDINRTDFDSAKILEMIHNGALAANRTWPTELPQWWTHPDKPPSP